MFPNLIFLAPPCIFRGGHKDELAAAATTGDIGIGVFLRPEAEAGVKWAVKTEEGAILSGVQNRGGETKEQSSKYREDYWGRRTKPVVVVNEKRNEGFSPP